MAENSLVKELEMSRTPIREALQKLQHEGFLKIISNQGIMVTSMSLNKLEDLINMRVAIETFSLKQAAKLITNSDFNKMKEIISNQKKSYQENNILDFRKEDADFHYFLLQITNNHYFLKMFNEVYELQFTARARPPKKNEIKRLIEDHEKIVTYLSNNEIKKAEVTLTDHLNSGKKIF